MIKTLIPLLALASVACAHTHKDDTPLVYGVFSEECYAKINEAGVSGFIDD